METKLCQSCGMPLVTAEDHGTNRDGSMNEDYCCYCYKNGAFAQDCSMEEMIENCIRFLDEFNIDSEQKLTKEQAYAQMQAFFPTLKRWKK